MAELQRSFGFRGRGIEVKDITFRRHKGNARSIEANKRCSPFKESTRVKIVDLVKAAGANGMTQLEMEVPLKKSKHKFSGRCTALVASGTLAIVGDRDGHNVYVYAGSESNSVRNGGRGESPGPRTGSPVLEGRRELEGGGIA